MEEIVRWATPVIHFRRTATEDTEINGFPIEQGEKVVMFYNSGNRDERVFDEPVHLRRHPPAPAGPGRFRRRRARTSASAPTSPAAR